MKKVLLLLIFLIIPSILLVGCNNNDSQDTELDSNEIANENEDIKFEDEKIENPLDNIKPSDDKSKYSEGLLFELNDDGTGYVVVGIGKCSDKDVIIPPIYEGKPVVAIGTRAFYPLATISVKYINSVSMPDSIIEIGEMAFAYNPLTEIKLPNNLRIISQAAFLGTMIESVIIPDSVMRIETAAFMSLYLKSVYIGRGLSSVRLGTNAFLSAALEEIKVSNDNFDLFVINGALYSMEIGTHEHSYRLEAFPSANKAERFFIERNHTLSNGCLAFAYNLKEIHIQNENGTPCGPAFVSSYRIPLVDIAKLQNGSIKLSEINEQNCIHTNESITDVYLNMTKSAFLSKKRNLYILPKSDGMRYEGYVYHFTDGIMSIEEYASLIN